MVVFIIASCGAACLEGTRESYFFTITRKNEEEKFYGPYLTHIDVFSTIGKLLGATINPSAGSSDSVITALSQFSSKEIPAFNAAYPDAPGIPYWSIAGRSFLSSGGSACDVPKAPPWISKWSAARDPCNPLLAVLAGCDSADPSAMIAATRAVEAVGSRLLLPITVIGAAVAALARPLRVGNCAQAAKDALKALPRNLEGCALSDAFRAELLKKNPDAERYSPTYRAITFALKEQFAPSDVDQFYALGVFPKDAFVPEAVVCAVWGEDAMTTRARLVRLQRAGLAKLDVPSTGGDGTVALHDEAGVAA
jgi:hypothetical protein